MSSSGSWSSHLTRKLPLLGHRNWLGVVDAAYPLQKMPGIETIFTGANHLLVLKKIWTEVTRAPHVRPRVLLDAELDHLAESSAPGVGAVRTQVKKLIADLPVISLPHDEIIRKLDTAARQFQVMLFKTTLTIPYTSIFLELDCGYWSDQNERAFRNSLPK